MTEINKPVKSQKRSPFGERLHHARIAARLSQIELAEMVGIKQSSVAGLERTGVMSKHAEQLAEACGVNVQWLLYGLGTMQPLKPKGSLLPETSPGKRMSAQALELATVFDNIPESEWIARAMAYKGCLEAILAVAPDQAKRVQGKTKPAKKHQ